MKKIYCPSVKPDRRGAQSCAVSLYILFLFKFFIFLSFLWLFFPCIQQLSDYLGKEQSPRLSSLPFFLWNRVCPFPFIDEAKNFQEERAFTQNKGRGGLLGNLSQFCPHHLRWRYMGWESAQRRELRGPSRTQSFKVRDHGRETEAHSFQETDICCLPPSSCFLKITLKIEMNFGLIFFLPFSLSKGTSESLNRPAEPTQGQIN